MAVSKLKIDPEFQKIIPPLTDDEFEQLRENILADGEVYEPIVVWDFTIIDGHNRWRIIQEHPDIPYHIRRVDFVNKWAAFDWMFKKQLGRRNLTGEQRTDLIGRMYEARKKNVGAPSGNSNAVKQLVQNEPIVSAANSTAAVIANEMGIAKDTVKRAEKFAHGIDAIRDVSNEAAEKILRGGSGVNRKTVIEFPNMKPVDQAKLAEAVVSGTIKNDTKKTRPKASVNANARESVEICKADEEPSDQEPATVWDPARRKRIDPLIEKINADNRDLDRFDEYTLEDMLEEMGAISRDHISQLRRVLEIRSTMLNTDDTRKAVAEFLTESVQAIESLKTLVLPYAV